MEIGISTPKEEISIPDEVTQTLYNNRTLEIEEIKWTVGRYLGKGGQARVFLMESSDNNSTCAAKFIQKNKLSKYRKSCLRKEIRILRQINCENICNFYNYFENDNFHVLTFEVCNYKTMHHLVLGRKRITENEGNEYLLQLMKALAYLHVLSIMHRDVKSSNMFLTLLNQKLILKLGDFGFATKLEPNDRRTTRLGTPNVIAPEVLNTSEGCKCGLNDSFVDECHCGHNGYSFPADIWSSGVSYYFWLTGIHAFETSTVKETYERICEVKYNSDHKCISPNSKILIQKMLQKDPQSRPNAQEVLSLLATFRNDMENFNPL